MKQVDGRWVEVNGIRIFDSMAEVVEPRHTALIVIDMQNDLLSPDGIAAQSGVDITAERAIIPTVVRLVDEARRSGVRVVYTQTVFDADMSNVHPAWIYRWYRKRPVGTNPMPLDKTVIRGTWGAEIIPELEPQPHDYVVEKARNSAFVGTKMDRVLRANGVESVVLAGVTTQGCVLSSALDSQWYDYYTVIAKDAVASTKPELHQLGMEQLSTSYHLPTVEELAAIWAEAPVFVR